MTESEIREYLGLTETDTLDTETIEGMKDLPYPQTDAEHVATFATYLKCRKLPDDVQTREAKYETLQAEHNAAADLDPNWPADYE